MCRYACDLQPMLKVLAGAENIEKLLHIDASVSKIYKFHASVNRAQRSMRTIRINIKKNE